MRQYFICPLPSSRLLQMIPASSPHPLFSGEYPQLTKVTSSFPQSTSLIPRAIVLLPKHESLQCKPIGPCITYPWPLSGIFTHLKGTPAVCMQFWHLSHPILCHTLPSTPFHNRTPAFQPPGPQSQPPSPSHHHLHTETLPLQREREGRRISCPS